MKENKKEHDLGTNGLLLGLLPKGSSYSCIQMNGKETFHFAVLVVPRSIELALEKAGLTGLSIDWLLLHQQLLLVQVWLKGVLPLGKLLLVDHLISLTIMGSLSLIRTS